MNKILKWILIIFIFLIAILIILGFILYNFIPIKVATLCLSDDSLTFPVPCTSNQMCINLAEEFLPEIQEYILNVPDFAKPTVEELTTKAVYCEQICKVKKIQTVYVIGDREIEGLEKVDVCNGEEYEIKMSVKEIIKVARKLEKYNN